MCGRFYFGSYTANIVEKTFNIFGGVGTVGDVTPGMSPMVLSGRKERLTEETMHWGIKNRNGGLIINARAESVYEKPMFSESMEYRRIIIPAEHFYEWDRDKNKVTFSLPDSEIIYLAGFYNLINNVDSFVILTTEANESMEKVHDRMPLMIEAKDVNDWIMESGKTREFLHRKMPELHSERKYEQLSLF
ncbi:MAG: SOS response-associated peptidase [Lachnospiraceae bacterium]|nr:SOS response-associated peptidase [Lachnospiraceae bacterium]